AQEPAAETPGAGGMDWLSQPAAPSQFEPQAQTGAASSTELEEDWLASFEAPLAAPTASTPSNDSWLSELGTSTPADVPAESTSFDLSAASAPAASSADDWLGSLGAETAEPASATTDDDWLGSLGAGGAVADETPEPLG